MYFYATFITGLQEPVARLAEEKGLRMAALLDGALVYESEKPCCLPCFTNVFAVLSWKPVGDATPGCDPLAPFIKKTAAALTGMKLQAAPPVIGESAATFRIICSMENKLVSMDKNIKARMEKTIQARTGLQPERAGAGQEFWFLYRREGYVFFLRRLTTHTAYDKILRKGALHPELAYMLQVLSLPSENDRLWDPFCGSGAIPAARLAHFPCKAVYASDNDPTCLTITRNALAAVPNTAPLVECRLADIQNHWLPDGSVNKIVTDPPWGFYDENVDIAILHNHFLKQCLRVVVLGGIIVVLTSRNTPLRELLSCPEYGGLTLRNRYEILVSGKKASAMVIGRT